MPERRTLALIVGTLLLTLSSLTLVLAQGYPTEDQLLVNPGFDEDADENGVPDGWSTTPERALLREKVFMGGDRELVSVGNTYVLAIQGIELEPGETYTVAFRARATGGGTAGALIVHGKERPTREMSLMWNVALDEEYAEYWAPFKAPNPVAVLYIYNVAKKGQVTYDWVSLIKGKPERAYVRQFRFGERDDPDEDPVVLPHTPWATPLSGGSIKAMVALYRFQTIRELVELSHRLELDYDAVEGGSSGESLCSPTGRRLMRRLDAGEYEVYVIASRLDERLEKEVRAKVGLLPTQPPADAPDGQLLADITVRDAEGGALYWGCGLMIDMPQEAEIAEIALDKEYYEPGDTVAATVTTAPLAEGLQLNARLVDAHGRLILETQRPAADGAELTMSPPAEQMLCVGHKLFVQLMRGDHEVDSAWTDVYFPRLSYQGGAQDFQVTCWGDGYTNAVVSRQYSRMLADLGLNGKFGSWPYVTTEFALTPAVGSGVGHVFWPGKPTGDGVRHPCLSDPAIIEKYTGDATEVLPPLRKFGVFAVNLQDEATLANRHERYEVCFSEYCQARYRKWLKDLYGDMAALNAEWGTNYADFDDITGARTEDVRGADNFAPFVDFRTFMTDVWVEAMGRVTDSLKAGMPETRIGHTNTFGSMPTNGVDYYKLCTQTGFEWAQEYSEAIKGSAHKAVFDLWRSFCPPDFPNYGWIGYDHRHEAVTYEPWWLALHGSRGVSYFACNSASAERGKSYALVHPTQAYTPYSRDVKETITDLREQLRRAAAGPRWGTQQVQGALPALHRGHL